MFGTTYTMFSSQSIHNSWTAWTSWVGPYSTKTLMEMSIRWGQAQGKFLQDKSTVTVTVCHYTWGLFSLPQYQRCVISWKSTSPTASQVSMLINKLAFHLLALSSFSTAGTFIICWWFWKPTVRSTKSCPGKSTPSFPPKKVLKGGGLFRCMLKNSDLHNHSPYIFVCACKLVCFVSTLKQFDEKLQNIKQDVHSAC